MRMPHERRRRIGCGALVAARLGSATKVPETQALETAKENANEYRLHTRRYWYRLQREKGHSAPAIIRWEYDRETLDPSLPKPPRHHVQLAAEIEKPTLDLDKL